MTEKVKVPKWFDEWYKSFDLCEKPVAIYYLAQCGFGGGLRNSLGILIRNDNDYFINKNREKLIRAILDGYEVEEEYIEIDPFEAYEYFYKGKDIYSDYKDKSNYNKTNISEFEPRNIKENNIIFYIKKENE